MFVRGYARDLYTLDQKARKPEPTSQRLARIGNPKGEGERDHSDHEDPEHQQDPADSHSTGTDSTETGTIVNVTA